MSTHLTHDGHLALTRLGLPLQCQLMAARAALAWRQEGPTDLQAEVATEVAQRLGDG